MLVFVTLSAASTLCEDEEMLLELVFMAPSATSTLEEELERLTLEI
jgi:hypothetical protein